MSMLGKWAELEVMRETSAGYYLNAGRFLGDVLLPGAEATLSVKVGDKVKVFLYLDSEDRPVATFRQPKATVGDFVNLKVVDCNVHGAFLDWGLPKDLFLPFREQKRPVQVGQLCLVHVYVDLVSGRIQATRRISKYLQGCQPSKLREQSKVELIIFGKTELGYKAIVNKRHEGLLYHQEVFQELKMGQEIPAYVKKVREDGKIDLSLTPIGKAQADLVGQKILAGLEKRGGEWHINDRTPAEEIYEHFHVSKKAFKKSLGVLYKNRKIDLTERGIRLLKSE